MELEGACEGTLACSTCHCIFTPEMFDKLPPADEEELDMLDLAAGLTDTSRLGCQVVSHLKPPKRKKQPTRQLIIILLISPNAQYVVVVLIVPADQAGTLSPET